MTTPELDPFARLTACLRRADPLLQPDLVAAAEAAEEARGLAQALNAKAEEYRATAWLARHWLYLGRIDQAFALADGLRRLDPAGSDQARTDALQVVVLAGSETGKFDAALDAAESLMTLAARSGDEGQLLTAAASLAIPLERLGNSWQAERVLSKALASHGERGAPKHVMNVCNALCAICARIAYLSPPDTPELPDLLARGRAAGERALQISQQLAQPAHELVSAINLAEVMIEQGELGAAETLLRQSCLTAHDLHLSAVATEAQVDLCAVLVALQQPSQALELLGPVLNDTDTLPTTLAKAHRVAYRAHKALANTASALTHLEQVEQLERYGLARLLRLQSEIFVTRNEELYALQQAAAAQHEAQAERVRAAQFAAQAEQDPLTGLGNRRHLRQRTAELFGHLRDRAAPLALAQLDVDHFKRINDTCGHAAGDKVLQTLANLLREGARATDIVARVGGEEFVIVLPETPLEVAYEVCDRLRLRVAAAAIDVGLELPLHLTVSTGLATAPGYELDELLHRADLALYAAKQSGRNRVCMAEAAASDQR